MSAKQFVFHEVARHKIRRGVGAIAIASLILSVDCLIPNAPKPKQGASESSVAGAEMSEF